MSQPSPSPLYMGIVSIPKKICFHSFSRPLLLGIVFDTYDEIPPNLTRHPLSIGIVFDTHHGGMRCIYSHLCLLGIVFNTRAKYILFNISHPKHGYCFQYLR